MRFFRRWERDDRRRKRFLAFFSSPSPEPVPPPIECSCATDPPHPPPATPNQLTGSDGSARDGVSCGTVSVRGWAGLECLEERQCAKHHAEPPPGGFTSRKDCSVSQNSTGLRIFSSSSSRYCATKEMTDVGRLDRVAHLFSAAFSSS